ncbi:uromodulin-like 1, partial [Python bivittatus]|uniref:Uromodulin-like 1 n=1 Tax=Python bivittatus TaxID=176946 RepID=A0A9F5IUB5_PYTBI
MTKHWYNVSVLVKMDFSELSKVDPRLLNHSRLLHSMITGALWPMNISVYHIQTTKSETYAETLASQILIGLQQLVPLVNISSLLKDIVMRVYEVIDIAVQDSPPIRNHKIFSVTSSSFEASWSVNSLQNHSFRAEVYKGKELVQRMETTDMKLNTSNLEAGVMYTLKVSYEACGKNITSYRNVKTDALIFGLTLRILNYNFTDQFLNMSSREYQTFSRTLMAEFYDSVKGFHLIVIAVDGNSACEMTGQQTFSFLPTQIGMSVHLEQKMIAVCLQNVSIQWVHIYVDARQPQMPIQSNRGETVK